MIDTYREGALALIAWAKNKPEDIRERVVTAVQQLRMLMRRDDPRIRKSLFDLLRILAEPGR